MRLRCSGVREAGSYRGWPEREVIRLRCSGVREAGFIREWPDGEASRLRGIEWHVAFPVYGAERDGWRGRDRVRIDRPVWHPDRRSRSDDRRPLAGDATPGRGTVRACARARRRDLRGVRRPLRAGTLARDGGAAGSVSVTGEWRGRRAGLHWE